MPEEPNAQNRDVDDSEFLDIARDPADARSLRNSLELLRKGAAGPILKEMAEEVLSGRLSLRQAVNVSSYAEAGLAESRDFQEKWAAMSDAEREELAAQGEAAHREAEREAAGPTGHPTPKTKPRHDGSTWSLY
ncbi:hypothetical protein H3146_25120 [Streptomyces sp. OF3]|uniref:Uncharacterized protein n=1 Tax=Streptomyces alkaliterrae TaxID=2213162 RepID=A0A7W3ZQC0_9ACTN|nr:hypothetical protein [Streptomyces alkaliterrae]MBB1256603.1 hypothetical protein [Streptomyces alkaliterrae]